MLARRPTLRISRPLPLGCAFLFALSAVAPARGQQAGGADDAGLERSRASVVHPQAFSDAFDEDHDYLAQDIEGTGWDGYIGEGPRETADRIAAVDGTLVLQSTHGRYQEGWDPLGPLLYKSIDGDFKATVRIVDYQKLSYNNCGIMARAANPEDAGAGEDWISVDYFPIYGGIYARMADDGRRAERGSNGQGGSADKYLQMELVGNLFFLRHSPDGATWQEMPRSPFLRSDLVNVPLQVGLFQATYSGNQGRVAFDDFSLERGERFKTARLPDPEAGAQGRPHSVTLSWVPGSGADHHDVYFGRSRELVSTANRTSGPELYKGRQDVTVTEFDVRDLKDGETYYWRIDEVAGDRVHPGEVWCFSTFDPRLADFEDYVGTEDLIAEWTASGTGTVTLAEGNAHGGSRAMLLDCEHAASPHHAQADYTFARPQDWWSSLYSFRSLRVHFRGDPANEFDRLYMAFEDDDWGTSRTVVEYEDDLEALRNPSWTTWNIDLQQLVAANPSFRLGRVTKMSLGLWSLDPSDAGGSNKVTFDDISLQDKNPADGPEAWPLYVHPERMVGEVPFDRIEVTGGLWRERIEVNRTVSLPHVWGRCEQSTKGNGDDSRRLDNFRKAAGEIPGDFTGTYFNDSDVYKIIEGTANSLQNHPDPELEAYTDRLIDSIAGAQWEDGYLFTFYSLPERRPSARWSNVGSMHELYCAGHLFEAGVAYHRATGKRKLLDVSIRFADLICETFGPEGISAAPGHQEIELALLKLHDVTGERRYKDTARFFIEQRGRDEERNLYGTYSQDHVPFVDQEKGVGHSVRAGYLFCAATDLAALDHDEAFTGALFRLWDNIVNTKTYITGGIGQPGGPEGFAGDYELGNSCYAETCSGIAFAMWNDRLHRLTGESKYADLVERTFLNNMLSSLSVEGDRHFYTNPLTSGGRERWEWPGHDCACCPSNLVRVIASIGGYAYSHDDDTINVNQYLESEGSVPLPGNVVTLLQTTRYPWSGEIAIEVRPETDGPFRVKLRIPGWARNQPMPGNLYKYLDHREDGITLEVNGAAVAADVERGYVTLERHWSVGDTIRLSLPMSIRRVIAHPKAIADKGLVAVERGPLVYCVEYVDNSPDVSKLKLPDDVQLTASMDKDLFGGVVTLRAEGEAGLKLIPYYLHSNRGQGWMRVWLPRGEGK